METLRNDVANLVLDKGIRAPLQALLLVAAEIIAAQHDADDLLDEALDFLTGSAEAEAARRRRAVE